MYTISLPQHLNECSCLNCTLQLLTKKHENEVALYIVTVNKKTHKNEVALICTLQLLTKNTTTATCMCKIIFTQGKTRIQILTGNPFEK